MINLDTDKNLYVNHKFFCSVINLKRLKFM